MHDLKRAARTPSKIDWWFVSPPFAFMPSSFAPSHSSSTPDEQQRLFESWPRLSVFCVNTNAI